MGNGLKIKWGLIFTALLFLGSYGFARNIRVIVKAPWNTPTTDTLYVCNSKCHALTPQDHLTYAANIRNLKGSFSVNRGSNQTAAVDAHGIESSFQIDSKKNEKNVFSIVNWKDLPPLGVIGEVQKFTEFYSPQLSNFRNISVWLPPGYHESKDHYPVIYMHDGQNVFDPTTSTTGVDWRVDDIMQEGVLNKALPPAIVVAVDCIKDKRYDEYDYTVKGDLYGKFLIETVKPFIDENFRTKAEREFTSTMGSSMGGLISLALLWKHSDVFSKAAGLSLAVHVHDKSIYEVINSSPKPTAPVSFYMDHGGFNDDSQYEVVDKPFAAYLFNLGFNTNNFIYDIDPYGDHREVDWSRRVRKPLSWLLSPSLE